MKKTFYFIMIIFFIVFLFGPKSQFKNYFSDGSNEIKLGSMSSTLVGNLNDKLIEKVQSQNKVRSLDVREANNIKQLRNSRLKIINNQLNAKGSLQSCFDDEYGVRFLCNDKWELLEENNSYLILMSRKYKVSLTVAKLVPNFLSIYQLSKKNLEAIGMYQEGFATENVEIDGLNAIKVKAYSKEDSSTRLSDYYFVKNEILYGLFFSVSPDDKWGDYKFLFQEITKSFEFSVKEISKY